MLVYCKVTITVPLNPILFWEFFIRACTGKFILKFTLEQKFAVVLFISNELNLALAGPAMNISIGYLNKLQKYGETGSCGINVE